MRIQTDKILFQLYDLQQELKKTIKGHVSEMEDLKQKILQDDLSLEDSDRYTEKLITFTASLQPLKGFLGECLPVILDHLARYDEVELNDCLATLEELNKEK